MFWDVRLADSSTVLANGSSLSKSQKPVPVGFGGGRDHLRLEKENVVNVLALRLHGSC